MVQTGIVVLLCCAGNVETTRWNCTTDLRAAWTHRSQWTKRHHLKDSYIVLLALRPVFCRIVLFTKL